MSRQRQRSVEWFFPNPLISSVSPTGTASSAPSNSRPTFIPTSTPSYSSTFMSDDKRPPSPPSIPTLTSLVIAPRRFRTRPSIIALVALLTLSVFCILHQHLNDSPISKPAPFYSSSGNSYTRRPSKPLRPIQVKLSNDQELAALIGFMAALPSNAIPDTINISQPLDPDLILGFDIRSSNAAGELKTLVEDTWARVPIVLLSKKYSPIGREIKSILAEYNLLPAPVVFDVDERADEHIITSIFQRLLGTDQLPLLLLHGESLGTLSNIHELHSSGQLRKMILTTSAVIDGAKKKKGRRRTD
ncbi:hypothetical protein Clacol_000514 [Clathrus columnatus]|uniref:Uncharacterized protein n=1 Tax=Clathrus columnatus TaxID=1419009 RepID=A0AAV4ZZH3_9AGAM|nr:hypothetical protein Clacol_000514 [Clathrus columnatus]